MDIANKGYIGLVQYYAVITGDIVNSSDLTHEERKSLLALLGRVFSHIQEEESAIEQSFDLFRGDSFQGLLKDPVPALRLAMYIRLNLLADADENHPHDWDARMAIGVGEVSYQGNEVATSDGKAFRLSGPVLDQMKREERIKVNTQWDAINAEMAVSLALCDGISSRWTSKQAQVMLHAMAGRRQSEMAQSLGISQPAVSKMLRIAHWEAVEALIQRYELLITQYQQS